jgi:amino acid permease
LAGTPNQKGTEAIMTGYGILAVIVFLVIVALAEICIAVFHD